MIVQIYEVTCPSEAQALVRLGVDHIGVLVGKGRFPRELDYGAALDIFTAVPPGAKKVALTLSPDFEEIVEVAKKTGPDILHIGTLPENFRPADVKRIKRLLPDLKIMIAIPVIDGSAVDTAGRYEGTADFLLLDTYRKGDTQIGATGRTHDWEISRQIVETVKVPVILAGGLGPDNVFHAVRKVRPWGIDSKTKTDKQDGSGKDLERVAAFVRAAKRLYEG